MQKIIALDNLRVDCNIGRLTIQNITISSKPGEHTIVIVDAWPDSDKTGYVSSNLSGQPMSVRVNEDEILFYGVIYEVTERWEAGFLSLRIIARSLSWLLDLEKKSRSFQKTESQHTEIIANILDEYGAYAISNFKDRQIDTPYIQYNETDWEFIRRITSRLGVHVIPSDRQEYPGLYIGFPDRQKTEPIDNAIYRFGIDDEFIRKRSGNKSQYIYYDVEDYSPRQLGDAVVFQGAELSVCEINARLDRGVLRFAYRLAGTLYNKVQPEYNSSIRGLSLTGTVLA